MLHVGYGQVFTGSPIVKGHNHACGVGQCHLLPLWGHSDWHLTSLLTSATLFSETIAFKVPLIGFFLQVDFLWVTLLGDTGCFLLVGEKSKTFKGQYHTWQLSQAQNNKDCVRTNSKIPTFSWGRLQWECEQGCSSSLIMLLLKINHVLWI